MTTSKNRKNKNIPIASKPGLSVGEAALMVAVCSAMAFQSLRFEPYEAEKLGVLGILVMVMVGAGLAALLARATLKQTVLPSTQAVINYLRANPLVAAVGGLLIVTLLSTLFSLNPAQSLIGAAWRSQGLIALVFYAVLFWVAARAGTQFRGALAPILLLTTIPICLYSLLSASENGWSRDYAASTAGNTNFLASWLVVVLLYSVPYWLHQFSTWPRPLSAERRRLLALLIVCGLLALATLLVCGSRGALLGLILGGLMGIVLFIAATRRRKALIGIMIALFLFGVGYVVAGRVVPDSVPFARLLRPYDETRVTAWNFAAEQILRQAEPLKAADGSLDRWATLRPVFGFGLENIDQIQVRFGDPFSNTAYVDHFHNLIFDTLIMQGWLGLLALVTVYLCAVGLGLTLLGMLSRAHWWRWLALQALGAAFGVIAVPLIIPQLSLGGGAPLGAAFGAVFGTLLWVAFQANTAPTPLTAKHALVIATLAIITAQWVDNQFGFTQIITQTLWWIIIGGLVALQQQPENLSETPSESIIEPRLWLGASVAVGLFILAGFGDAIRSSSLNNVVGVNAIPILLGGLLLATGVGAFSDLYPIPRSKRTRQIIEALLGIATAWGAFFMIKVLITAFSGDLFDTALASASNFKTLPGALQSLPLIGVLAVAGSVLGLMRIATLRKLQPAGLLVIALFWAVGSLAYAQNYAGAALHYVAGVYTSQGTQGSFDVADVAFESALQAAPVDIQTRVDWLYSLLTRTQVPQVRALMLTRIEAQTKILLGLAPYYPNTRTWQLFQKSLADVPK